MASLALRLKNTHQNPLKSAPPTLTFSHLFSSSSSNKNDDETPPNPDFSSYFSDIKSRLKNQQQQSPASSSRPFNFSPQSSPKNPPNVASFDEIRKNLSEFSRRASVLSSESQSQNTTSLQDIYNRNVNPNPNPNPNPQNVQKTLSFDVIRRSLRQMRLSNNENSKGMNDRLSLNKYKENFSLSPSMGDSESSRGRVFTVGKSSVGLPESVFGREMKEREKREDGGEENKDETEFIRPYTHDELGRKLRELRPEPVKKPKKGAVENQFSLGELNERLRKLREIEKKQSKIPFSVGVLRNSIAQLQFENDKQASTSQRFDLLGSIGRSPSLMHSPPKEHLVEKYFHPDNMSSEEKLKLELKKVRDEFKMHESDCGSARVQIAQLTTEILHLSSVLHKKDKHSRRGLLAKVQQRKKLLKYLRRTDWDSYCFVLSKLGLRDNPDYKN